MTEQEKLYDAFGELIYTVAIADGYIQPAESDRLRQLIAKHPWAAEIQWSFDYEVRAKHDVTDVYKKALDAFERIGPNPEYTFMLEVLEQVARASSGMDTAEQEQIVGFKHDLIERFTNDLDRLKLKLELD